MGSSSRVAHLRRAAALVAAVLAFAACGEGGLLDGLGTRSQSAVRGSTTTSTSLAPDGGTDLDDLSATTAAELAWFNDDLEDQYEGEPSFVVSKVFQRGASVTRFVQASRMEIALALPEIAFPSLVPSEVGWITSQLVFDTLSGQLDPESAAAFGMWAVEPYTVDEGRVAVLRVGFATESDLQSTEIRSEVVEDGLSLLWAVGDYRYELFCRAALAEELCWQMAESVLPLADQLGRGSRAEVAAAPSP